MAENKNNNKKTSLFFKTSRASLKRISLTDVHLSQMQPVHHQFGHMFTDQSQFHITLLHFFLLWAAVIINFLKVWTGEKV